MASRRWLVCIFSAPLLVSMTAAADILQPPASAGMTTTASDEVETFVREAMRDRLLAGDIPDIKLLPGAHSKRLYVRSELPASRIRITSRSLPSIPGTELALITLPEAQEVATRTRQSVHFIVVDHVHIDEAKGRLWLGVGLAVPPGNIALCCCEREAQFERREGRWVFERWGKDGRCY